MPRSVCWEEMRPAALRARVANGSGSGTRFRPGRVEQRNATRRLWAGLVPGAEGDRGAEKRSRGLAGISANKRYCHIYLVSNILGLAQLKQLSAYPSEQCRSVLKRCAQCAVAVKKANIRKGISVAAAVLNLLDKIL